MILETAQLLSCAHRVLDGRDKKGTLDDDEREHVLYQKTHANHPCAVWVRASTENYEWLYDLFVELLKEFTFRYGKTHTCARLAHVLACLPKNLPEGELTPPALAMPDEFKTLSDDGVTYVPVESYRAYYVGAKTHLLKWKRRDAPSWVVLAQ
jgi:hypothetical protein